MMDAANYAKARQERRTTRRSSSPADQGRRELLRLRAAAAAAATRKTSSSNSSSNRTTTSSSRSSARKGEAQNARVAPVAIAWSRDSNKFSLIRRDVRKVKDLWVINSLANPRPTLETYRYAMPGEENTPQSEIYVFDVASRRAGSRSRPIASRTRPSIIATKPQRARSPAPGGGRAAAGRRRAGRRRRGRRNGWRRARTSSTSRASAATCTGSTSASPTPRPARSTPLIEERLNTYIESKPLRLATNGAGPALLVGARRLGPLLPATTPPPAR